MRPSRDEIEQRVRALIDELLPSRGGAARTPRPPSHPRPGPGRGVRHDAAMTGEHAAQVLAIYQAGIDEYVCLTLSPLARWWFGVLDRGARSERRHRDGLAAGGGLCHPSAAASAATISVALALSALFASDLS